MNGFGREHSDLNLGSLLVLFYQTIFLAKNFGMYNVVFKIPVGRSKNRL
jgi:hypothetical protein